MSHTATLRKFGRIRTPKNKRVVITLQVALTTTFEDGTEVLAHSLMGELTDSLEKVHKVSLVRPVWAKISEPLRPMVTLAYRWKRCKRVEGF